MSSDSESTIVKSKQRRKIKLSEHEENELSFSDTSGENESGKVRKSKTKVYKVNNQLTFTAPEANEESKNARKRSSE